MENNQTNPLIVEMTDDQGEKVEMTFKEGYFSIRDKIKDPRWNQDR